MKTFVLLLSVGMFGCSSKTTESTTTSMDRLGNEPMYFALPLGVTLDQYKAMYNIDEFRSTVDKGGRRDYIEFDCAVIVSPTEEEVVKIETTNGPDDESIKLNTKHTEAVSKMIEQYGVKTIPTTERFINFKGIKGTWELDLKKDWSSDWKVILFKNTKEPVVLPNILVTIEEVEDYFEISK